jgi:hypothetical protein
MTGGAGCTPPPHLFDACAPIQLLFCRDALAFTLHQKRSREFRASDIVRVAPHITRITMDANVLHFVDRLVTIERPLHETPFPTSVHLLISCEPVVGGLFNVELETLSKGVEEIFDVKHGKHGTHGKHGYWTLSLLDAPFPVVIRESVESISVRAENDSCEYVSLVPRSKSSFAMPPSCTESSHVSSLSFPIHCRVETLEIECVRRTANGIDFRISASQVQNYMSTKRTDVRATLRGACATLVESRGIGANEAVVKVRLHARMDFQGFPMIFVEGHPWRLVSSESDAYHVSMRLRRLCAPRPALGDLLDCEIGAALCLLPCCYSNIDGDILPIETNSLLVAGKFEIRASDEHMILEQSLALSKGDAYARFLKDVFVQGNMVAETISHVSDRAFKRNIVPRSPKTDLAILRELKIYDYDFLDRDAGRRHEFGVVADELEALMPEAVQEVDGFVANVYSHATFSSSCLIIDGSHALTISADALLQLNSPGGGRFEVRVSFSSENDGKTFVTIQDTKMANGTYFVYGTWTRYKVANTTHLLMACINAMKHLMPPPP